CLPDHYLASNDRLDSELRGPVAGQDSLTGKAKRDDLTAASGVGLELRENARTDKDDLVTRRARFAERPPGFHLDDAVRHSVQQLGETRLKARRDQRLAQSHGFRGRPCSPTRHVPLPRGDDAPAKRPTQGHLSYVITHAVSESLMNAPSPGARLR